MPDGRQDEAETPEIPANEVAAGSDGPEADPLLARVGPERRDLRRTAARGTVLNSTLQIGFSGLTTLQRVIVAAYLTRSEFGLWGIIASILINLGFLKDLGIGDKYLQQNEPDQERAYQKAFTLELLASIAFFVIVSAVLPLWAIAYDHESIILPGILACLSLPISAFEMPLWIPYRKLDYVRHRKLGAIDPIGIFVVTVVLAIAGAGVWCFPVGIVAGSIAGAIVLTVTSPYPVRLVFDRSTLREYASFSWPLMGAGLSRMVVIQGSLLVANHVVGIDGIASIALASSFAVLADRVDGIVGATLFPAICAVVDRRHVLAEVFVKSNRVALMWAMPFGVGLALFAGDLVDFVIGDQWRPAVGLLAAFGLTCAVGQVAFNWAAFMRATNNTRPLLVSSVLNLVVFALVSVPAMYAWGVTGYAAGFAASNAVQLVIRSYYMGRMFEGFSVLRQMLRAVAPTAPPAALVLALHVLAPDGRTLSRAIAEVGAYSLGVILLTWVFERSLVTELIGYLRGRRPPRPVTA
jgi:O-antigen/teichoic acid export membrane protein